MVVNFSNNRSELWSEKEKNVAAEWGEIVDMPFPNVDATLSENDVSLLAEIFSKKIIDMKPKAVICQGEFSLTFAVVSRIKAAGIPVYTICSQRTITEYIDESGRKIQRATFEFVKFREYI